MKSESDFYNHYKETFSLQQEYLSERNKLTVTLLVLLALVAGFIYDPNMVNEKVNTYIASHVDHLAFELKYLNTAIIFLLLWVITRYYQIVMHIERTYNYLSDCENKLSEDKVFVINREGAYYLKSYPWFKDVVNTCYVVLLPLAIIAIAVFKIIKEVSWETHFKYVDFVGLGLIVFFSLLYISNRCFREEYFNIHLYPDFCFFKRLWCYLGFKKVIK